MSLLLNFVRRGVGVANSVWRRKTVEYINEMVLANILVVGGENNEVGSQFAMRKNMEDGKC